MKSRDTPNIGPQLRRGARVEAPGIADIAKKVLYPGMKQRQPFIDELCDDSDVANRLKVFGDFTADEGYVKNLQTLAKCLDKH